MAYFTGRGGAGNARSSSQLQPPPSKPTAYSTTPRYVSSGIGGAGNYSVSSEAATQAAIANDFISAASAASRPQAAAYMGRGGAGNVYRERKASSSSAGSMSSGNSIRSDNSMASSLGEKTKMWVASLKR